MPSPNKHPGLISDKCSIWNKHPGLLKLLVKTGCLFEQKDTNNFCKKFLIFVENIFCCFYLFDFLVCAYGWSKCLIQKSNHQKFLFLNNCLCHLIGHLQKGCNIISGPRYLNNINASM